MRKLDEIAERAISRVDIVIVGDVIAVIAVRRSLKRHQPDRRHPKPAQIVEAPHQSLEIAGSVSVCVHISTY